MKKISIYLRNANLTPSSYYRIFQYTDDLKMKYLLNINETISNRLFIYYGQSVGLKKYFFGIVYYIMSQSRLLINLLRDIFIFKPDIIFVSKSFAPRYTLFINQILIKHLLKNRALIWDFDDDIINSNEINKFQKKLLLEKSKRIIVTHKYLKSVLPEEFYGKIIEIPTTDGSLDFNDSFEILNYRLSIFENEINITWLGTSYNLSNLYNISEHLNIIGNKVSNKSINLYVICDKPLNYKFTKINLINIKWDRSVVKKILKITHIGLMPLENNSYNSKKGGFKIIQYMSSSIPVVVSDVGVNIDIVGENAGFVVDKDWLSPLEILCSDKNIWTEKSRGAYHQYISNYSYRENFNKLLRIFGEM